MASAGGQTIALDVAPAPNLAQSYLDVGKIQAQQDANKIAPLDLATKQQDLQQKQALAPLQLKEAQQNLVIKGMEARSAQTKAEQDAADRTMERVGKAALAVSNASAEDRPGEWQAQLDGLLKTKTIDQPTHDALMKQPPTDELLNHVIDGHRTYSEMLKQYDAKTKADDAKMTPAQIARESDKFQGDLDSSVANKADVAIEFERQLRSGKGAAEASKAAKALSKTADQIEQDKHPGQHYGGGFLGLIGNRWQPNEAAPAASAPTGVLPPASATPATTTVPNPLAGSVAIAPPPRPTAALPPPVPATAPPAPIGKSVQGMSPVLAARFAGPMFANNPPAIVPAAAPPPAKAAAAPAKNDKLGGNSEADVLAHARAAIKADPRLAEPYKQRLKDLGIDPGKL